jgi:peptidoglycan/LPS O-acetylase OafA/YrhL
LLKGNLLPAYCLTWVPSSIYMHNIIYSNPSSVLGLAWSLEIEVQFYILAPFLCFIFLIKHQVARRILLAGLILLSGVYSYNNLWKFPTMLPYFICYFFSVCYWLTCIPAGIS